jgi:hypothetical protein
MVLIFHHVILSYSILQRY